MSPRLSRGVWGTALLALTGVWLVLAPFAVGVQMAGRTWTDATRNDLVVGGCLAVVGVLGVLVHVLFWARDVALAAVAGDDGRGVGSLGSPG